MRWRDSTGSPTTNCSEPKRNDTVALVRCGLRNAFSRIDRYVGGEDWADFERLLADEGYPFVAVQAKVPHGWVQVRQEFPGALQTWAARLVATSAL